MAFSLLTSPGLVELIRNTGGATCICDGANKNMYRFCSSFDYINLILASESFPILFQLSPPGFVVLSITFLRYPGFIVFAGEQLR